MSASVNNDRADELLRTKWHDVIADEKSRYVDDDEICQSIHEVLNDSQLTYKYILVTNVIAKATNPEIHYRSMQAQWGEEDDVEGAYNARSLGHTVLVEWEKEHGERLGGSNEPFLNKPARYPSFSMDNSYRSEAAHRRLYELLQRLEEKTEGGEVDPVNVLQQTLYEISNLDPQTVDFESPSSAPYRKLASKVQQFTEKSGGGERLAAVAAGVMRAYYFHASTGDGYEIEAEHANVPDEFSDAAGDVEVKRDGKLVRAMEVKDKPSERSDIQHAITKARENELGEYLYLVGAGWSNESEHRSGVSEIEEAPIEVILLYPEEIIQYLKLVGDEGRVMFIEQVGEFLNAMRAEEENKEGWKEVAEEFS